jgi:hypothetical protein
MKLELFKSKNKDAADDSMVDVASDRFYDDDGYDEGDWGRADKKYAPGATYDHEMKNGKILESASHADVAKKFGYTPDKENHLRASATNYVHKPSGHQLSVHKDGQWELHGMGVHKSGAGSEGLHHYLKKVHFTQQHESKNPDHGKIKSMLNENGFSRGKGGVYTHASGVRVKYPLLDGTSFHVLESNKIGSTAKELKQIVESCNKPAQPVILNTPLLSGVLKEAVEFQKLDTKTCDICGGNHPEATHVKAPGAFDAKPVEEAAVPSNCAVCGHDKVFPGTKTCAGCGATGKQRKKPVVQLGKIKEKEDEYFKAGKDRASQYEKDAAKRYKVDHTNCVACKSGIKYDHNPINKPVKVDEGDAEDFQAGNDQLVGMTEDELAEKRKGIKHNPINQKGSLWQQFKKKLQLEDEADGDDPSPDELQKAELGKKTDGKEVLDELGEAKKYTHKIWTGPVMAHDKKFIKGLHTHYPNVTSGTEHVYVRTNHPAQHVADTLKHKMGISGFKAHEFQTKTHSEHKPDPVTEAKKKFQAFDQGKEVRAISRERIGQPKGKQIIKSKKLKPEKYKPNFRKELE